MEYLKKEEIDNGFIGSSRVYLCGNLQKPTLSKFIHIDDYEIGITKYTKYTFEKAHYHSFNHEYNYVINGHLKVLLLKEKKEISFDTGDLFVITPNEPYVCKAMPDTCIIFTKNPGGNDKVLIEINSYIRLWGENWENVYEEKE